MQARHKRGALRELDELFRHGAFPPGDDVLLGRFLAERNESAFEALVARHGPMVLGVCQRILIRSQDVDDAFQATFLVLVRKASQLRDPERLGPWLYGVATRVATKARTRRHRHEPLVDVWAIRTDQAAEWSDLKPVLDAELGRLPAKHRDVLVLCILEGASTEEAARRLGCPVGTIKSRLARGRETLRARLVRRGIAPTVAALWSWDAAPVSASLIRATWETIAASAVAPGIATLSKGATPSMITKSTLAAAVLVGGFAIAGVWTLNAAKPTLAQERAGALEGQPPQEPDVESNLKAILLAFHTFHDVNNRFPAAALYGADGQPKLSWRVALLPYLDQKALYEEFHLDEAWDSPHNLALIPLMPAVFEAPRVPAPAGQTRIRGFIGKGAFFDGTQGSAISDITDGTSYTVLLAIAQDASPWTKPGELPFVAGKPLPALDGSDPKGYPIALCDGSVRVLPKKDVNILPSLITRAGGEVTQWTAQQTVGSVARSPAGPTPALPPQVPGTPGALPPQVPAMRMPGMMASMMGSAAPAPANANGPNDVRALELRVRRLESELQRVLKKLDAFAPSGTR